MALAPKQLYVAVIGATGGVGKAFIKQLEGLCSKQPYLKQQRPISLSLIYSSRSAKALLQKDYQSITFDSLESTINASTTSPLPPKELTAFLQNAPGPAVVIDNTSSQQIAEAYPLFLQHGISVVTPNKKAFSGDYALWQQIFRAAANGSAGPDENTGYVFHESTVGACLPVICTLKDLLETGDVVERVEGVFSGTMSFLFNSFMPATGSSGPSKFSEEVKRAKELGYTEPDPREDLNGLDVARKLTIVARLCGVQVESPTSFPVQSLIPKALESCTSADEFVGRLPDFDGEFEQLKKEAAAEGKVLRYVGSADLTNGKLNVGVQKFDAASPIGGLTGAANVFSIKTQRYADPLVVQGAGAGSELTAMGVTADLVHVVERVR